MKNKLNIILGILLIIFLYLYFFDPKVEEVKVPVTVEIPVPVVEKVFDTIYEPKPIYIPGKTKREIDSIYYEKYKSLKDSIKKDSLFKEAIKIEEYKPFFEDDTLRIDVYAKVRGKLLETGISYKTKPRTIKLDTTIIVPIPTKAKVFGGFELMVPTTVNQNIGNEPVISGKLYLKTKKDRLWSVGITSQKQVVVGYAWKF